jgi:DNA polymerase III epsilon subunit-like protein
MTVRIMIDLETLGTAAGCSILSIGACRFDGGAIEHTFHAVVGRKSCAQAGLVEDEATLAWWDGQTYEVRETLRRATVGPCHPLGVALQSFRQWVLDKGPDVEVWSNGADFDLPILAHAYRIAGFGGPPWQPYTGRCYRTLKNLRRDVALQRDVVAHDALADAVYQAEHAVLLLRALGVEP